MKKLFFLLSIICISFDSFAYTVRYDYELQDSIMDWGTITMTKSDFDSMVEASVAEKYRKEQVTSICGIDFGDDKTNVEKILQRKYGYPDDYDKAGNSIMYKNIRYSDNVFDRVFFLFQSDGNNDIFNGCIFCKFAKNKKEAIRIS